MFAFAWLFFYIYTFFCNRLTLRIVNVHITRYVTRRVKALGDSATA